MKVTEEINELKKCLAKLMIEEEVFEDTSSSVIEFCDRCYKLVGKSCVLMEKQAEQMDQMDRKLDMILEKLNKKEKA